MDTARFTKWLASIDHLDATQRQHAFQALALAEANYSVDAPTSSTTAEAVAPPTPARTAGAVPSASLLTKIGSDRIASFGCPHCGGHDICRWGQAGSKPRYRCATCRKTFNPLTGTSLAGLHHQDRLKDQAQALIEGETVAKAAKRCDISYATAFRWRHRFRSRQPTTGHLEGGVQAKVVEVVAIGITTGDGEDTFAQQIRHRMGDLSLIPGVREERGQLVDHAKALVGSGEQEDTAVGTDRAAVECRGDFLLA